MRLNVRPRLANYNLTNGYRCHIEYPSSLTKGNAAFGVQCTDCEHVTHRKFVAPVVFTTGASLRM